MPDRSILLVAFLHFAAAPAAGQTAAGPFPGLVLGAEIEAARSALADACEELELVELDAPRSPLAEVREAHLVCRGYRESGLELAALGLGFADGGLAWVEAQGPGAVAALGGRAAGEPVAYAGYLVHPDQGLVLDEEADTAWLAPPDAMHHVVLAPGVLDPEPGGDGLEPSSVARPAAFAFGAPIDEVRPTLAARCRRAIERPIDPPDLPTGPERQVQIDCLGFSYAGLPRKVEAVFADGELALVWVLTGGPEEDRIRRALVAAYGEPVHASDAFEVFGDGSVALRKDVPEVLFLSAELAALFAARWGAE